MPGKDAFDNVPKRRPPNLPGYEEECAEYIRRKQGAASPEPVTRQQTPKKKQGAGKKQAAAKQTPAKQAPKKPKRPVNPARRRRNRRIAAVLAIIALIGVGMGLCFGFLFKIDGYTVYGDSPYTKEEIVAVFHPREGDNMFGFSAAGEAALIEQQLPYLAEVNIRRRLPSTIVFQVEAATEKYYIVQGEGQVAILSDTRKVLRVAEAAPEGLTEIRGLTNVRVEPGFELESTGESENAPASSAAPNSSAPDSSMTPDSSTVPDSSAPPDSGASLDPGSSVPDSGAAAGPEDTDRLLLLDTLLAALDKSGLSDITWVDVGDPLDLRFRWQDRITVKLGAKSSIEERINFVVVLFTDPNKGEISQTDRGVLDASTYPATDKVWLVPE